MQAILNIISNPVNSTVPIAAEILKQKGVYDPKRLFGVTTLDVVCFQPFLSERHTVASPTEDSCIPISSTPFSIDVNHPYHPCISH